MESVGEEGVFSTIWSWNIICVFNGSSFPGWGQCFQTGTKLIKISAIQSVVPRYVILYYVCLYCFVLLLFLSIILLILFCLWGNHWDSNLVLVLGCNDCFQRLSTNPKCTAITWKLFNYSLCKCRFVLWICSTSCDAVSSTSSTNQMGLLWLHGFMVLVNDWFVCSLRESAPWEVNLKKPVVKRVVLTVASVIK